MHRSVGESILLHRMMRKRIAAVAAAVHTPAMDKVNTAAAGVAVRLKMGRGDAALDSHCTVHHRSSAAALRSIQNLLYFQPKGDDLEEACWNARWSLARSDTHIAKRCLAGNIDVVAVAVAEAAAETLEHRNHSVAD